MPANNSFPAIVHSRPCHADYTPQLLLVQVTSEVDTGSDIGDKVIKFLLDLIFASVLMALGQFGMSFNDTNNTRRDLVYASGAPHLHNIPTTSP